MPKTKTKVKTVNAQWIPEPIRYTLNIKCPHCTKKIAYFRIQDEYIRSMQGKALTQVIPCPECWKLIELKLQTAKEN